MLRRRKELEEGDRPFPSEDHCSRDAEHAVFDATSQTLKELAEMSAAVVVVLQEQLHFSMSVFHGRPGLSVMNRAESESREVDRVTDVVLGAAGTARFPKARRLLAVNHDDRRSGQMKERVPAQGARFNENADTGIRGIAFRPKARQEILNV